MNYIKKMKNTINVLLTVGFGLLHTGLVHAKDIPGSSETSYGVSSSGAFSFQIPIVLPQGTNGVQPNLAITYSSSGGSGLLGKGWGVSGFGGISRCGKSIEIDGVNRGVQHDSNDRFCLNGKRLILVSGTYGASNSVYRTEIDEFSKVVAHNSSNTNLDGSAAPSYFVVWRKDGSKQYMGFDADSRYKLPSSNSIHRWQLSRAYDRSGNYYRVVYQSQGLINYIDYTINSGLSADKKVDYIYEPRPDTHTRYVVGKKIVINKRIKEIRVTKGGTILRLYKMAYQPQPSNPDVPKISRLESVTQCGIAAVCLPPISIAWKAEDDGFENATVAAHKPPHKMYQNDLLRKWVPTSATTGTWVTTKREVNYGAWVDLNGDGETDQLISVVLPDGTVVEKAYIKEGNAWVNRGQWYLPKPLRNYKDSLVNHGNGRFPSVSIEQGQFVDVDADGLVDIVYAYRYHSDPAQTDPAAIVKVKETWLNNGNGWTESPAFKPKDYTNDYVVNHHHTQLNRLVDVNGDGLLDWVRAYFNYSSGGVGTEVMATWLNTGTGWSSQPNADYALPDVFAEHRGSHSPLPRGEFVDLNGDGLVDWLTAYRRAEDSSDTIEAWINTGSGWDERPDYRLPEAIYDNAAGWNDRAPVKRGSFLDINGDGLRDYVRSYTEHHSTNHQRAFINTGKGWAVHSGYKPQFVHLDFTHTFSNKGWPTNTRGFYIDLNRDGLVDYTQAYKDVDGVNRYGTWLNTGSGWHADSSYNSPWLFFDYSHEELGVVRYGTYFDINSDGAPDWVRAQESTILAARLMTLPKPNQLERITTTMDVEIEPSYLPLTANDDIYQPGTHPLEANARRVDGAIYVVSSLAVSSADGSGWNTTNYKYRGGQASRTRGFLGFKERFVISQRYQNGNPTDITQHQMFRQDYPFTGTVSQSTVTAGSTVISSSTNTYDVEVFSHGSGNARKTRFPFLQSSNSQSFEYNGGAQLQENYQYLEYDSYGNIEHQYTAVGSALTVIGSGSVTGQLNSEVTIDNVYYPQNHFSGEWLVGRVDTTTQASSAPGKPTKALKSKFTYYAADGKLQTATRQPDSTDPGIKLVTSYTYDGYGNMASETGTSPTEPNLLPRESTIGYDAQHRLPETVTNAEGHSVTTIYHPHCDAPGTVTDPNGHITSYTYDQFCRQTSESFASGGGSTIDYFDKSDNFTGSNCHISGGCQTAPKFKTVTQKSGEPEAEVFLNLFGQPMLSKTQGMLPGDQITQIVEYDRTGRKHRETQPYFANESAYWTDFEYDVLDRPTVTKLPYDIVATGDRAQISQNYGVIFNFVLGQVSTLASQTTVNPRGSVKKAYANPLGQVVQIVDADNKSMTYAFDVQGNLITTTDALGNQIHVGYDVLGRRTSLDDPDLGMSAYKHSAFGDLIEQQDAKNQTLTMQYDRLSRMVERTVPGTPGKSGGKSVWQYDTAANGIGSVAVIAGPSQAADPISDTSAFKKTFSYDQFGRPSADATRVIGKTYNQAYTYNAEGLLDSRGYPDSGNNGERFVVKHNYSNGYLLSISGMDENNDVCVEHWRADKYDALGRVKQETLGTIVQTTRGFKPGQNVLETIQSKLVKVNPDQAVQNLSYTYDANNNLESRHDTMITNSVMETFTYDGLDRLRFHYKGSATTEVRYDDIGNIKYKSDVGSYSYNTNGVRPHAVKRVNKADPSLIPWHRFEVNVEWEGADELKKLPNIHNQNFVYDSNGNITKSGDRRVSWTAFDKPSRMYFINADSTQKGSSIRYGADLQRIWKRESTYSAMGSNAVAKETTTYIGKDYQRITDSQGVKTHRYTISTGSNTIQIDRADGTVIDQPKYLLGDNLGSTNVILNAAASVEQRLAFDPWGLRTNIGDSTAVNAMTNKGYTGHEMDDEVGLVNMNARIYDPYLGRFLSADPVLPDAGDMQAYNRYAYVLGNPLKYGDPSGNSPIPINIAVLGVKVGGYNPNLPGSGWHFQNPDKIIKEAFRRGLRGTKLGNFARRVTGGSAININPNPEISGGEGDQLFLVPTVDDNSSSDLYLPVISRSGGFTPVSNVNSGVPITGRDTLALLLGLRAIGKEFNEIRIEEGNDGFGYKHIYNGHRSGAGISGKGEFLSTTLGAFTSHSQFHRNFARLINSSKVVGLAPSITEGGFAVTYSANFVVGLSREKQLTNNFLVVLAPSLDEEGVLTVITAFPLLEDNSDQSVFEGDQTIGDVVSTTGI